jgi:hypothetical protein
LTTTQSELASVGGSPGVGVAVGSEPAAVASEGIEIPVKAIAAEIITVNRRFTGIEPL